MDEAARGTPARRRAGRALGPGPVSGPHRWRARAAIVATVLSAVGLVSACQPLVPAPKGTPLITATATPTRLRAGSPLTLTVVVASDRPDGPVPTGTVHILNGGPTQPLVNGVFTYTLAFTGIGLFSLPFDYSGDDQYLPGAGTLDFDSEVETTMVPFTGSGPSVGMAGDSITHFASPSIEQSLAAGGYRYSVTGLPGATTTSASWLVDEYAAAAPDVFVLDLGTNDLSDFALGANSTTVASLEANVSAAAAKFPGSCVVVSTLSAHRSAAWQATYAEYNAAAIAYNDWVRATFPHVVDWEVAVAASIAAGTTILVDEVHPTEAGKAVLGDLVRQAADDCAAPAPA